MTPRDRLPGIPQAARWLALLATSALLLACAPETAEEPFRDAAPTPTTPGTAASTPTSADPAPTPRDEEQVDAGIFDFAATDLDGGTVDARAYAGRDVAIWFWAPW